MALRSLRTIRGRIWAAFLVAAAVTTALGGYAVVRIDEVGQLAARTFDQSLVAVNVSSAQFKGQGLIRAVSRALAATGLAPGRLELEITETVLLSDGSATLDVLHELKRMGVRFAMDDFGTGFPSLNYLLSFPFDKIKIDQSFVRSLEQRGEARTIVRTMIQLGRSLGMRVTAEGVEMREQLERLSRDGCDEIQGYYFSRPVPACGLPDLLATCGEAVDRARCIGQVAPGCDREVVALCDPLCDQVHS